MATYYYEIGICKWVVFMSICTPCMAPDKAIEAYIYCQVVPSPQPISVDDCSVKNQTSSKCRGTKSKSNKLGYIGFGKS